MKIQICKPMSLHELGMRDNQEDNIIPNHGKGSEDTRIFVLCDGMGGYECGEVASKIVSETVAEQLNQVLSTADVITDQDLVQALSVAYERLDKALVECPGISKMGTTLTIVAIHKNGVIAAHIGDSRIYHLRPATQTVMYRSKDHSYVQQLYDLGEISYNEMKTSKQKNIILKAVMPGEDKRTTLDIVHIGNVQPGDYFFMCTDGMLENLDDEDILAILSDCVMTDEQKAEIFRQRTAGNDDNHSCHIIHIEDVIPEADDVNVLDDEAEARLANKALNDPKRFMAAITNSSASEGSGEEVSLVDVPDEADEDVEVVEHFVPEVNAGEEISTVTPTRNSNNGMLYMIIAAMLCVIIAGAIYIFMSGDSDVQTEPERQEVIQPERKDSRDNGARPQSPNSSPSSKPQDNSAEEVVAQPAEPDEIDLAVQHAEAAAQQIANGSKPSKTNSQEEKPSGKEDEGQEPRKQSSTGALNTIIQEQSKTDKE